MAKTSKRKSNGDAVSNEIIEESTQTVDQKDSYAKRMLKGLKPASVYFAIYFITLTLSELFIRYHISETVSGQNLFFLFFVPAEALFFTALTGFFKSLGNKINLPIVLTVIGVYYCVQYVYFKIFGSLFSVSMMKMGGTAVGNFFWAMKEILIGSIVSIFIFLAPTIASVFLGFFKEIKYKGYPLLLHLLIMLAAVGFWFLGLQGIKLGGTDRTSAYYVFHNSASDTDTTASHIGTLTTFIVEAGAYYFGIDVPTEADVFVAVDQNALSLSKEPTPKKDTAADTTADVVEEVPEEIVYEPWIDERFDFETLAANATDPNDKSLYEYFAYSSPTLKNEYTGLFEGYNLIYICAEGFWSYACNEKATPTLYKMANNGIVLTNYYNAFLNTTTNGEYAFSTSLWPDVSRYAMAGTDAGSFPQSASKYMPYGLGDMFNSINVPTYGFHNYYGTYYRRNLSWPNLGYNTTRFMGDMRFTTSWPSSDFEMFEQSVDNYINDDQFHAYYMTFSGHGPYNGSNTMANRNINDVKALLGDDAGNYNNEALCYLSCNKEFDKAMEYLLQRLEEAGKLDNTVIVIAGDHYPYYLSKSGMESLTGKELSEIEQFHSTCIIYNAGLEEPIVNENYCCNIDILPTILNLFNIPFDSRLLMGTDIFSQSNHTAMLYNKSFINEYVYYNAVTGEAEWKIDTSEYSEEELSNYLDNYSSLNESKYLASINIIKNNFYFHLWKDAGLLTEEQINEENARSKNVVEKNAAQNAAEAEAERARQEAEAAAAAAAAAEAEAAGVPQN